MAQKPGYTRYVITKYVSNGQTTNATGGAGYWFKFDNNLIWVDMGFTGATLMRYEYNTTKKNGVKLYYSTPYNHGTMSQGSGYITNYNNWILVSNNRNTINIVSNNGKDITVLKKQTVDDVPDMIE